VKGPNNAEIETPELEIIYHSFAEASVPQGSMIGTIEQLYDDLGVPPF
jgi:hypothetical protein